MAAVRLWGKCPVAAFDEYRHEMENSHVLTIGLTLNCGCSTQGNLHTLDKKFSSLRPTPPELVYKVIATTSLEAAS
jgi:hypothetical protein